jgi:hypothetical protein
MDGPSGFEWRKCLASEIRGERDMKRMKRRELPVLPN